MKVILDDRRHVPNNSPYNVVRNYEDCVVHSAVQKAQLYQLGL